MYEYKGKPDVSETNRTFAEIIDTSEIADKQHAFAEEMRRKYYDVILYSISSALTKNKDSDTSYIRIPIDKNLIEDNPQNAITELRYKISEMFPKIESIDFVKDSAGQDLVCILRTDRSISAKFLTTIMSENVDTDSIKVKIFASDANGDYKIYPVALVFKGIDSDGSNPTIYLSAENLKDLTDVDFKRSRIYPIEVYYKK